jgi:2-hydroxy-3-oxopropionate reductase
LNVTFVGLGIMGRPMALNLLRGGHTLRVHGRRPESMQPLKEAGATACPSPGEAARGSEVIFIMVSDTPDVEQVIFAPGGVAEGAAPGSVIVDMSTISPVATRSMAARLAQTGVQMLDAPVSGGDIGAINGTLSIMVGGKPEVFGRVKPLFECMGKNIVLIGANGAGQVAKGCNQILAGVTLESVAEALTLARKNEVDPGKVREALLGGLAWSKVLEIHGRRILERDFKPGFKAKLHQKDLRIVTETAAQLGIGLPQSALVAQHLNALLGMGCGDEDSSAVAKVVETLSGLKI